jgi:hypothetical protein
VARPCPNCNAPFLVRKNTKARGEFMRCQSCYHEYTIGTDDSLEPAGVGIPTPAERRARKGGDASDAESNGGGYRRGARKSSARDSGAGKSPAKKAAGKSPAKKAAGKTGARKTAAKKSGVKTAPPKKAALKKPTTEVSTAGKTTKKAAKKATKKPTSKRTGE